MSKRQKVPDFRVSDKLGSGQMLNLGGASAVYKDGSLSDGHTIQHEREHTISMLIPEHFPSIRNREDV